uniref:Odorant-binding protein 11 n=1 Tax=Cyrtorhinus lividipennis TaxID=1032904 RepID=A0A346THZ3_9HEMI|nr:odorant-binding protein 11 [Cyrtorhinus lividipennis]
MYTLRTFLVLGVSAFALAAPPTDEPAECLPPKDKMIELATCCKKLPQLIENEVKSVKECFELVKEKPSKDGPPTPPKPEGFDCMEDCVMSKMGLLDKDKQVDAAKLAAVMKDSYTGDWAPIKEVVMKKCENAAENQKAQCRSGADLIVKCIFRETYMNCPASQWTTSDLCKANKERLEKCPKAMPFCPKGEEKQ